MSYIQKFIIVDMTTEIEYETLAKDAIDAKEQVADLYDLSYNNLTIKQP